MLNSTYTHFMFLDLYFDSFYQNWSFLTKKEGFSNPLHMQNQIVLKYALSFYRSPNFLSQPKNLTAYSASSKTFAPSQKTILLDAKHLFVWHKKIGPAQNIYGPVKGQGISIFLWTFYH